MITIRKSFKDVIMQSLHKVLVLGTSGVLTVYISTVHVKKHNFCVFNYTAIFNCIYGFYRKGTVHLEQKRLALQ